MYVIRPYFSDWHRFDSRSVTPYFLYLQVTGRQDKPQLCPAANPCIQTYCFGNAVLKLGRGRLKPLTIGISEIRMISELNHLLLWRNEAAKLTQVRTNIDHVRG